MKLPAVVLAASLAINAAGGIAYFVQPSTTPSSPAANQSGTDFRSPSALGLNPKLKTQNLKLPAAFATGWSSLDSDDLKTLVAQLHAAGFPRTIIRAIVTARVHARFAPRLNALARSAADTPYWKPTVALGGVLSAKLELERSQILRERAALLRETLGEMRELEGLGERVTTAQRRQFGDLSKTKIQLLQRINDDYAEMTERIEAATSSIRLPEDRERLALLEREKRADVAAVLTPQELEDYELHTSPLTSRLRSAFTVMDASEAEFRTLFRLQQQFESILNPTGSNPPPLGMAQREAVQQQLNDQIKAALGETRATEFTRAADSEYRQLVKLAQRENLPAAVAIQAYELRTATSAASLRIYEDKTLDYDQKLAALKTLADSTRAQLNAAFGPASGSSYAQSASWINRLDQGMIVTPAAGGWTSIRTLERPPLPASKPSGN